LLLAAAVFARRGFSQQSGMAAPESAGGIQATTQVTVAGTVLDAARQPVAGAEVCLRLRDGGEIAKTTSDAEGKFGFVGVKAGGYTVIAQGSGQNSDLTGDAAVSVASSGGDAPPLEIVLHARGSGPAASSPVASSPAMEFSDAPSFTIAGVTDWTAVGGHGSDSMLRTSEDLARETLALKAKAAEGAAGTAIGAAQASAADAHRLAGQRDEQRGDPLSAVREFERAVRLDPSEQNYFEWGSDLLLHRALWQAKEVFQKGVEAYPKSARMLTGLGAALFSSALYDEAALRLCAASDLDPTDATPYLFMGKIAVAAPSPLPCVREKLARFARLRPDDAQANYLDAMAILHDKEPSDKEPSDKTANDGPTDTRQAETLLVKAAALDPKGAEALYQLGVLASARRDGDAAIAYYQRAIQADPQLGEAHYRLGVAYDRLGRHAEAAEQFRLHDEIEKREADRIEQQRREVKQFLVVLQKQPDGAANR